MSRFGQLRSLRRVSDFIVTRRNGGAILSARNDNFFLVEITSDKRLFSALTPCLANRSPDGGGPTPPPTGSGGDNKKGTYSGVPNKHAARLLNFSDFSFLHALIRDYTIIKIPQKILPTCLFRPTRLFFSTL